MRDMQVTLKMSGLIARLVPGSAEGTAMTLPDGATLSGLMARIGLPGDETYLIIVNDSTVTRDRYGTFLLSDGDSISIVPPLRGG